MSRSHFNRALIDKNVGVISGASVSVVEAGSNTLVDQLLWKDPNTITDYLPNPFIAIDGVVDFYTDDVETVGLIITYGGVSVLVDYLDALPPIEELVSTSLPLKITNGASGVLVLAATGVGTAEWTDAATILARTNPVVQSFSSIGNLAVQPSQARWYNDVGADLTLRSLRASVGTAPTGQPIIVDLLKNGVSMYATPANRPTIPPGGNTMLATLPDSTLVSAGDYLSISIIQVGSPTPGADLTVGMVLA